MRDLQFDAAGRIGLDEIDKGPGNSAGGNLLDQKMQGGARRQPTQKAAYGATGSDIDGSDPQDGMRASSVDYGVDLEVDVIDADDLAPVDVDDLLIEQITIQEE